MSVPDVPTNGLPEPTRTSPIASTARRSVSTDPRKIAEVVVEGQVDDAVGRGRSRTQTVEIVEGAAVRLGAGGLQRGGGLVGAGQAGDLMPSAEQFGHQCRPDVSRRAGDENSHDVLPEVTMKR